MSTKTTAPTGANTTTANHQSTNNENYFQHVYRKSEIWVRKKSKRELSEILVRLSILLVVFATTNFFYNDIVAWTRSNDRNSANYNNNNGKNMDLGNLKSNDNVSATFYLFTKNGQSATDFAAKSSWDVFLAQYCNDAQIFHTNHNRPVKCVTCNCGDKSGDKMNVETSKLVHDYNVVVYPVFVIAQSYPSKTFVKYSDWGGKYDVNLLTKFVNDTMLKWEKNSTIMYYLNISLVFLFFAVIFFTHDVYIFLATAMFLFIVVIFIKDM